MRNVHALEHASYGSGPTTSKGTTTFRAGGQSSWCFLPLPVSTAACSGAPKRFWAIRIQPI